MQFYSYIMPKLEFVNIKPDFLNRNVNEGFSGGEKKRNEILQLAVCIQHNEINALLCTSMFKPDFHCQYSVNAFKMG